MIDSIQEVLQEQATKHAPLAEWIDAARGATLWDDLVDQWHEISCQTSLYAPVSVPPGEVTNDKQ